MGASLFLTDPVVAAAYFASPGQWVWVNDDIEAAWLVDNRHAYTLSRPVPVPAPYYVSDQAPPFVPFVPEAGPVIPGKPTKPDKPDKPAAPAAPARTRAAS